MTSVALAVTAGAAVPAGAATSGEAAVELAPASVDVDFSESYTGFLKGGEGIGSASSAGVFKVPELACGAEDEGFVITVYAFDAEDFFAAGSDLFVSCQSGVAVYDGHVTTSGGQIPIWQEMEPGDKIKLSITKRTEGPSTHDITFSSLTRDWSSTLPTNSQIDRIEIGFRRMSVDGVRIPPPSGYKTKVTGVRYDGVVLANADATKVKLVDEEGEPLSRIRSFGKASFVLNFL